MQNSTIFKLNKLNSDFYTTVAEDFDDSRNHFWPGWHELLSHIDVQNVASILDIGCGNGRFGIFAESQFPQLKKYVGIDSNPTLLESAKKQTNSHVAEYQQVDIVQKLLDEKPLLNTTAPFDLVTIFGVMHHIPSFEFRKNLIIQAKKMLSDNGSLILATWQFMEYERFKNKLISPEAVDIEKSELEENDYFLDWKRGTEAIRYCHYHTQEEVAQLIENTGLKIQATFRADGKENNVNAYYLLKKSNQS